MLTFALLKINETLPRIHPYSNETPPPIHFSVRLKPTVSIGFSDFLSLAENCSRLAKICRSPYPRMCVMKQMNANLFHFFMKQYHCDHASAEETIFRNRLFSFQSWVQTASATNHNRPREIGVMHHPGFHPFQTRMKTTDQALGHPRQNRPCSPVLEKPGITPGNRARQGHQPGLSGERQPYRPYTESVPRSTNCARTISCAFSSCSPSISFMAFCAAARPIAYGS